MHSSAGRRQPRCASADRRPWLRRRARQETTYSEPEGDMAAFLLSGGMHGNPEPPGLRDSIGPTVPRGTTNGLIIRGGRIVAEWGDTERADMTFSATKSK